jgi:hypothetical protein
MKSREFNVAFFHSKGNGRIVVTVKNDRPLTRELLLEMEDYIQKEQPELSGIFIFSLIEFEQCT